MDKGFEREKLIRDLASTYGMADTTQSKYNENRYDHATGTYYCDGIMISHHTMDKALEYFKTQAAYLRGRADQNGELLDMYLYNTVAFNAINALREELGK